MGKILVNLGRKESGASMQRPMNCENHRLLIVYVNGVECHIEQREEKRLALFLPPLCVRPNTPFIYIPSEPQNRTGNFLRKIIFLLGKFTMDFYVIHATIDL